MQGEKPIKILLVDDMDVIIDIIMVHLSNFGQEFEYFRANDGRTACKLALSEQPDIVLMDWEMPKMNGIEALTILKKNRKTKDIPVVILSGFTEPDNIKHALDKGAVDYIRKPIDSIELIARVRSVLVLSSISDALKNRTDELRNVNEKFNKVVKSHIPFQVLDIIQETGKIKPKRYKKSSVLFAKLSVLKEKGSRIPSKRFVKELNDIYLAFDKILQSSKCTKIKSIGDTYLVVSGLPNEDKNHALNLVKLAIEFKRFVIQRNKVRDIKWELRIGVNSGNIVGSLVGGDHSNFDVFGDAVNVASMLYSHSLPMQIVITKKTYQKVKDQVSCCSKRELAIGSENIIAYNVIDDYDQSKLCSFDIKEESHIIK